MFRALNGCIGNKDDFQINGPCFYCKKLVREEQIKSKASGRKEIIKIRAEINKTENRKKQRKSNHKMVL